jgi:hypothetical protein
VSTVAFLLASSEPSPRPSTHRRIRLAEASMTEASGRSAVTRDA